jgi:polyisoprenoid-binding protein YceI
MRTSVFALAIAGLFATAVQAAPATYAIDPTHTFATFEIDHNGASTNRVRRPGH